VRILALLRNLFPLLLCACVVTPLPKKIEPSKVGQATPQPPAKVYDLTTNAGRHLAFRDTKTWKHQVFKDDAVLSTAKPENIRVQVVLGEQRGYLYVNDQIGYDFPVSTGRQGHETPQGDFKILVKELAHHSNLYGKILDAEGDVVNANADITKHPVRRGHRFEGAPMPFFMRLTNDGVGMHIGQLPGYAASHGCIRLPKLVAPKIYEIAPIGTPVSVTEKRG
jgi:lipoprotein-anchoring transpeptidase ErfK/SrfK